MDKSNRPTLKSIAELTGFSVSAVSAALNNSSEIPEKTKELIRNAAKEIGYIPNQAARNLVLQKTTSIGMIVPDLSVDSAYTEMINAVSEVAARDGLCLLLGSCNRRISLEEEYCRMMYQNGVGTLIISPCTSDLSHIEKATNGLLPILYLGGKTTTSEENFIIPDYSHSGETAVNYFYERGHRKIALFLYYPDNETIQRKIKGYTHAMESHNLSPLIYWKGQNDNTSLAGTQLVTELISRNELPTAIWCASDLMAYGVIHALRIHGYSVPEDVSVIGHDNLTYSEEEIISLTTFSLPKTEMGLMAVQFAKDMIAYSDSMNKSKRPVCREIVQARLIERNSVSIAKDWHKE